jgi:DNA-binding NtrC family response regulator
MDTVVNIATLILDDDVDLLSIIKETIDKAGITNYNLFTNEDDFVKGLTPAIHVCVVDHILDKKTGLDILHEIKEKNEFSYVIAYTGIRKPEVIEEYLNGGANKFVNKNKDNHLELLTQFLKDGLRVAKKNLDFSNFLKGAVEKIQNKETASATHEN